MRPGPVVGSRVWAGAAVVAVAVMIGVSTLQMLLMPGPWQTRSNVVVCGVVLVCAVARRFSRSRVVPTLWGLLAAVLAVSALYAGREPRLSVPLPTAQSLGRLTRLAGEGVDAVVAGRIPVEVVRGLEMLVVIGAVLVALAVDLLALGLGRAGLAGLPLAGLWAVPISYGRPLGPVTLVVGGASFLLLLAVTRRTPGGGGASARHSGGPAFWTAATAVVVAVAAVLAGTTATGLPLYGAARLPGTWGAGADGGPLRLSTELDMRASLGDRSDRPLLRYTTDVADVGPLRTHTVVTFDGREWQRSAPGELVDIASAAELQPSVPEDGELGEIVVRVGDLDQDRLPISLEPRAVEVDGSWAYDASRDEVVGSDTTTRDRTYVLRVAARDLSPETLRADAAMALAEGSPELDVPATEFAPDIAALAAEVAGDAGTTYDQALALQSWFRDLSQFRYDTSLPPAESEDAVWDFLNARTGYCVQYATAMAIMARTLGIPARVGIGFLPGQRDETRGGEVTVTGRQAHAWPELWFADAGWVRFEPTPAVQTGFPPRYADPFITSGSIPTPTPSGGAAATRSAAPGEAGDADDQSRERGQVGIGSASVPLVAVVGAGALVLMLLSAGAVVAWRRRRTAPAPQGAEEWWARLRTELASAGVRWSDASTPRQAGIVIEDALRALASSEQGGRAPSGDAAAPGHVARASAEQIRVAVGALSSLVTAVERSRYAPGHPEDAPEALETWTRQVTAAFSPVSARRADAPSAARAG